MRIFLFRPVIPSCSFRKFRPNQRTMSNSTPDRSLVQGSKTETSDFSRSESITMTTLEEYLDKTRRLLQLERAAEEEQNRLLIENHSLDELCQAGVALKKLHLLDRHHGLGGRLLLRFGYEQISSKSEEGDRSLPNHKLSPGDIVNLCQYSDYQSPIASGVVSKVGEFSITVAFDEKNSRNDDGGSRLSISNLLNRTFVVVQSVNDVTFRRLTASLDSLGDYKKFPGWILVEYLFGKRQIPHLERSESIERDDQIENRSVGIPGLTSKGNDFSKEPIDQSAANQSITYYNKNLNLPQCHAVEFCVNDQHPISIVHGPPGTGKTTVVVEIIRQLVKNRKKILACAPSNVAVDNLLEKLITPIDDDDQSSINVVRLGHPARTHSSVQKYSLDLILKQREYSAVLDDIRSEIDQLEKEKDRRSANRQRKQLRQELYEREKTAVRSILQNAQVVCGTLTSMTRDGPLGSLFRDDDQLSILSGGRKFDVAVIDECGQATELACWSPLLIVSGEKCILAGDHRQLPPTIISEEATKGGFDRSLMARISQEIGPGVVNMLTVQYRMNEHIMNWPSTNVYDGRLEADAGVAKRLLRDLPSMEDIEEVESALWFIDTSDCDMTEIVTVDDESKANIGEVRLVFLHVHRLISAGLSQSSIAVISPYNLQVQLLRTYLGGVYPNVSIRSVDGFQGQEREAVILSLVRSNDKGDVGFLSDHRRMNVAVTRAKRHLAIVADQRTVRSDQFLKSLLEYMTKNGVVKSALEYEDYYHQIPFSIDLDGLALSKPASTPAAPSTSSKSKEAPSKSVPDQIQMVIRSKNQKKKQSMATGSKEIGSRLGNDQKKEQLNLGPDWKSGLSQQLVDFSMNDGMERLEFPLELLAHQRAYVHEVSEQMGFIHQSENVGYLRRIVVQKKNHMEEPASNQPSLEQDITSVDPISIDQKSANEESISRSHQALIDQSAASSIQVQKESTKKKDVKKKPAKSSLNVPPAEDDDEKLMEKFAQEERHCKFASCHQSTGLLGEKCRFCIQIFCIKHAMPEVHGCGEAAKRHARMEYERSMGGTVKMTKTSMNAEKKERIQAKFDDKMKTLKEQRQQKKSK